MVNTLASHVSRAAAFCLAACLMSLTATAAPATAATTAAVGGCTVRPHQPYTHVSNGVRYASANIYVTCSVGRSGFTRARIMEADPGFDDTVAPWKQQSMFTIQAGQTMKVGTVTGRCGNFDQFGAEELYASAQVWVGGLWSDVAETAQVSATC